MSAPVSAPIVALSEKSSCFPTWFRRAREVELKVEALKPAELLADAKLKVEQLVKAAEPVVAELKAAEAKVEAKFETEVRPYFRSCVACANPWGACCAAPAAPAAVAAPVPSPVPVQKKWPSCFPHSPADKSVIPRRERLRCWVKKASAEAPATLEFRSVAPPAEQPSAPAEVPAPEPSKSESVEVVQ